MGLIHLNDDAIELVVQELSNVINCKRVFAPVFGANHKAVMVIGQCIPSGQTVVQWLKSKAFQNNYTTLYIYQIGIHINSQILIRYALT